MIAADELGPQLDSLTFDELATVVRVSRFKLQARLDEHLASVEAEATQSADRLRQLRELRDRFAAG